MQQWGQGGRQGWGNRRERERESRVGRDGGRDTEMTRRTRDYQTEIRGIRHNIVRNPTCMVTNAPLASVPGNEFHPLILITLVIHGGQVKRYRERVHIMYLFKGVHVK